MRFIWVFTVAGCVAFGCKGKGSDGHGPHDAGFTTDTANTDSGPPDLDGGLTDTRAAEYLGETYRVVDGTTLAGDVRVPSGAGPFPGVVLVPGGAFTMANRESVSRWATTLTDEGFVTFAITYRVNMHFDRGERNFPGPVQDVKCAVQWLRAEAARFRLDGMRVYALGSSAGGYYVSILGTTGDLAALDPDECAGADAESNAVQGVVDYFGPVDWSGLADQRGEDGLGTSEGAFVGSDCASEADRTGPCAEASATAYIDSADPPFFVLHSDDDPAIPVQQSRDLRDDLRASGVPTEYSELTGKGHGWSSRFDDADVATARDAVIAWLLARVAE